jgi:hypothetical protein
MAIANSHVGKDPADDGSKVSQNFTHYVGQIM